MTIVLVICGSVAMAVLLFSVVYRWIAQIGDSVPEWKHNNQALAINTLIEDINKATDRILIFGGKEDTYNNSKILDALKKKDIEISLIFEHPVDPKSPLAQLAESKSNMYLGVATQPLSNLRHFRVIDHEFLFIEKHHEPDAEERFYTQMNYVRFLPAKYAKQFKNIKSESAKVA